MASGGSSVQSAARSRSFDFGSDDVLCSYEDYTPQLDTTANEKRLDSSAKDLHENRVRSPSADVYGQPEVFSREDVIYAVEKCMKKNADNLMRNLEGISGRLTQLELYCHKLERSIGEFRTDMIRDQSEANLKLKSLEKHVHEVHRSVQIIRDKQELSETQKELAELQLTQKESTNSSYLPKNNEVLNAATSENNANNDSSDVSNRQLALALPHQISSPTPSIAVIAPDKNHPGKETPVQLSVPVSLSVLPPDHYVLNQANAHYYTPHQPPPQEQRSQNLQPELHYAQQRVKMHDLSAQAPPKQEPNVAANQPTQQPQFLQYQQHWSQPMQPQQLSWQGQVPRFQNPPAYAYAPNQHANTIPESHQGSSILLPAPYSTAPQTGGYGGSSSTISHLLPQHNLQRQPLPQASQGSFAPPLLAMSGYVGTSTYPSESNTLGYNAVYVIDGSTPSHLQSFRPGSYPPNGNAAAPLISSNHPYGDMIEKAVNMGYPRDQVAGVVFGMAESRQSLDLNILLDKLSTLASGRPRPA